MNQPISHQKAASPLDATGEAIIDAVNKIRELNDSTLFAELSDAFTERTESI